MIPGPTQEDLARDAGDDYAIASKAMMRSGLGEYCPDETLCWIRRAVAAEKHVAILAKTLYSQAERILAQSDLLGQRAMHQPDGTLARLTSIEERLKAQQELALLAEGRLMKVLASMMHHP